MIEVVRRWVLSIVFVFGVTLSPNILSAQSNLWDLDWTMLSSRDAAGIINRLQFFEESDADASDIVVERTDLSWAEDSFLYRFTGSWSTDGLTIYYLRGTDGSLWRLNGTSGPIHGNNQRNPPTITRASVAEYLAFFTFFVRADNGPFILIEDANDAVFPNGLSGRRTNGANGLVSRLVSPIACTSGNSAGTFTCSATVLYGDNLFATDFEVSRDGTVAMTDDRGLMVGIEPMVTFPIMMEDVGLNTLAPRGAGTGTPPAAQPDPLDALEGTISGELFNTLERLMDGRDVRLNRENTPFLAGMASAMMEHCNRPRDTAVRVRLAGFVAASSIGSMLGFDYSNPNLGEALGSMGRQQALLASGALAVQAIGCNASLDELGTRIADVVRANDAAGSRFVDSCTSVHGRQSCTCLANMGRQVIPDIATRRYDRRQIRQIIEGNPILGLTIALTCGIGNY